MGTISTVIMASLRSCLKRWGTERVLPPRTPRETRPLKRKAKDRAQRCILPNFLNLLAHKALGDEK